MNAHIATVLKRLHYPLDMMLLYARWYVAYPLSLRLLEQMMAERGISVDHSTVHRWVINLLPALHLVFHRRKRPVGRSWRMDETYLRVRGRWVYLYRAVDSAGKTIDFLLSNNSDRAAALQLFRLAIAQNGQPLTVTIDGSLANRAALQELNADPETSIAIRQVKYLNNIVERDHRVGFKRFRCASILLAGIELMHMIVKGQMQGPWGNLSAADQFYALPAEG